MTWYWLSSEKMTVTVRTEHKVIVEAPPIVRRFIGQHYMNLVGWMQKQPGFKFHMEDHSE